MTLEIVYDARNYNLNVISFLNRSDLRSEVYGITDLIEFSGNQFISRKILIEELPVRYLFGFRDISVNLGYSCYLT